MVILVNGILLFAINKWVAYLFVFSLFFRIIYAYKMRKRVKKASEEASGANSALNGKLVDSFSNYSIVKLFAGAEKERKILSIPRDKKVKTQMYSRYTMRLFWAIPGLLWSHINFRIICSSSVKNVMGIFIGVLGFPNDSVVKNLSAVLEA